MSCFVKPLRSLSRGLTSTNIVVENAETVKPTGRAKAIRDETGEDRELSKSHERPVLLLETSLRNADDTRYNTTETPLTLPSSFET
jgi:hypothetical protein